jgi:hypothetical protein
VPEQMFHWRSLTLEHHLSCRLKVQVIYCANRQYLASGSQSIIEIYLSWKQTLVKGFTEQDLPIYQNTRFAFNNLLPLNRLALCIDSHGWHSDLVTLRSTK